MDTKVVVDENAIAAGVAELRERFPRTQDLYREVCVLLFFRYGITPTANKLYQLVRKGTMSTPNEALRQFWNTLRERSRVTVEHADLPEHLKAAAGDMVAALWRTAQTISRDALADLQTEAVTAIGAAKAGEVQARDARAAVQKELELALARIRASEAQAGQLRQDLAEAAAAKAGVDAQLEEVRKQVIDLQLQLARSREEHAAEREKLADRTQLAEHRFSDMEKRALVEIDRERTLSAKLQKTLESERTAHTTAYERGRAEHSAAQVTIAELRGRNESLQDAVATQKKERDREQVELQSVRAQLEAAIRQAATDSVRAAQLIQEVDRLKTVITQAKPSPAGTVKPRKTGKSTAKRDSTASKR